MSRSNRQESILASLPKEGHDAEQPLAAYLEEWLRSKQSLRPSTRASYEAHVRRYLVPHLGSIRLGALHPRDIERMYAELAVASGRGGRRLSPATLRRIHATLTSALTLAVRRGLLVRNPASTVELPRTTKARVQTWSPAELASFLDATVEDRLHLLYLILGLVGLRRGEAVALRWTDVDLNKGFMRIERAVVRVGDQCVEGPPKSSAGRRFVAIDHETARRLHWHQCRQRLEAFRRSGIPSNPELVFTTEEGHQLEPSYVSRHFDALVARHALPRIRLHDLRHTSASIGLAAGESLVEVSRRLGHSSITVTADIYSHVSPLVARASAERLAATVFHN